jgi:hypothetical protein
MRGRLAPWSASYGWTGPFEVIEFKRGVAQAYLLGETQYVDRGVRQGALLTHTLDRRHLLNHRLPTS